MNQQAPPHASTHEPPRPATDRGRWFDVLVWSLARFDDFLLAMSLGMIASLVHPERRYFRQLKDVVDAARSGLDLPPAKAPGGEGVQGTFKRLDAGERYVVLSDHHLLYQGSPHDYVGGFGRDPFCNERILRQMLLHYAERQFVLIENGDVEDLVVTAPRSGRGLWSLLFEGIGPLGRLFTTLHRTERRIQLQRVQLTYKGLQELIRTRFHDPGRFVKLYGNHEEALRYPELLNALRHVYPGIDVYDYAVICSAPHEATTPWRPTEVVVCHGHQFDPWTNPRTAAWIGEAITESFSWAGQGADRIWHRATWKRDYAHRDNELVSAPSLAPSESGQFTPKVRHMGERHIMARIFDQFGDEPPWLILGHSHEPRVHVADRVRVERYVNSGAAGRYQDLVWCVEVLDGVPTLHAWFETDGTLFKVQYVSRRTCLEPLGAPVPMGHLDPLPWTRPSEAEVLAAYPGPSLWPLALRALPRLLLLLALAAVAVLGLVSLFS